MFSQCNAPVPALEEDRNVGGELSAKHKSIGNFSDAISDAMPSRRMAILMLGDVGNFFRCSVIDSRWIALRFGRGSTRDTRAPPLGGGCPRPSRRREFDFRFSMNLGRRPRRALPATLLVARCCCAPLSLLAASSGPVLALCGSLSRCGTVPTLLL